MIAYDVNSEVAAQWQGLYDWANRPANAELTAAALAIMTGGQGLTATPATATPTAAKIAEWVAALRGNDFAQGRNALRQPCLPDLDAFCCLGVACEISGLGQWHVDPKGIANAVYLPDGDKGYDNTLPPAVAYAYGLATTDGTFYVTGQWLDGLLDLYPDTGRALAHYLRIDDSDISPYATDRLARVSLVTLNDFGFSFSEIADIVECRPPGLFK